MDRINMNNPLKKRQKVLKDRNVFYRYPRTSQSIAIVTLLGIFFSKPLYDAFIADREVIDFTEIVARRRSA